MKKCICGKVNDDAMKFCEECGAPLKDESISSASSPFSSKVGGIVSTVKSGSFANGVRENFNTGKHDFDEYACNAKTIVPHKLAPCDGEIPIKQFFCAIEKSFLLRARIYHIIQVTNKRVIYCRMGDSLFGTKVDQEEVPLSDVASISIKRGFNLSIMWALVAFFGIIGLIFQNSVFLKIISVLMGALGIVFMSSKYFKIFVGSKSASNYPISSGNDDSFGRFGSALGTTGDLADRLCRVTPTQSVDELECELSAMILDIQQLGDYGIEKWKK